MRIQQPLRLQQLGSWPNLRPNQEKCRNIAIITSILVTTMQNVEISKIGPSRDKQLRPQPKIATLRLAIIDSGATHRMCNDASLLSDLKPAQKMQVRFGNAQELPCNMTGTLYVAGIAFPDALYIPGLDRNLIPVSATPAGLEWEFAAGNAIFQPIQSRNQILSAPKRSGLYIYQEESVSANITSTAELQDIHER